eukprot:1159332-Pelagomonas_calceolata.AAC.10
MARLGVDSIDNPTHTQKDRVEGDLSTLKLFARLTVSLLCLAGVQSKLTGLNSEHPWGLESILDWEWGRKVRMYLVLPLPEPTSNSVKGLQPGQALGVPVSVRLTWRYPIRAFAKNLKTAKRRKGRQEKDKQGSLGRAGAKGQSKRRDNPAKHARAPTSEKYVTLRRIVEADWFQSGDHWLFFSFLVTMFFRPGIVEADWFQSGDQSVLRPILRPVDHFHQAVVAEDHEVACFCLRSMIVKAASNYRVGMARQVSAYSPLHDEQKKAYSPPWFHAGCKGKRRALRAAVQTGQPGHAREILQKLLHAKSPDVHAMLRQPQHMPRTPLAQPVALAGVGLSARSTTVPLGRNHNTEALLRHGEHNDWMPAPDEALEPTDIVMQKLVAEQIGKVNGRASTGIDCVADHFIKYAPVLRP